MFASQTLGCSRLLRHGPVATVQRGVLHRERPMYGLYSPWPKSCHSAPKLHLRCSFRLRIRASISAFPRSLQFEEMTGAKIVGSIAGAFVIAFACDYIIADKKIFGGTTPSTVSNKEWWEETDKKFQAWPRTAGPPVVMNPISRQNFIVKSRAES
ncbi:hypothetical protein L1987_13796 [Smallanthus sonchifolius]|uniref:Uncharacterized protein n=1 Tax=Smallanthus sonchifolius TaxID=185202 RepID=A0ACB9JJ31_9ASTR|nr:hypothetical protein L1987_13796 [Smallanthus sonchifolius]